MEEKENLSQKEIIKILDKTDPLLILLEEACKRQDGTKTVEQIFAEIIPKKHISTITNPNTGEVSIFLQNGEEYALPPDFAKALIGNGLGNSVLVKAVIDKETIEQVEKKDDESLKHLTEEERKIIEKAEKGERIEIGAFLPIIGRNSGLINHLKQEIEMKNHEILLNPTQKQQLEKEIEKLKQEIAELEKEIAELNRIITEYKNKIEKQEEKDKNHDSEKENDDNEKQEEKEKNDKEKQEIEDKKKESKKKKGIIGGLIGALALIAALSLIKPPKKKEIIPEDPTPINIDQMIKKIGFDIKFTFDISQKEFEQRIHQIILLNEAKNKTIFQMCEPGITIRQKQDARDGWTEDKGYLNESTITHHENLEEIVNPGADYVKDYYETLEECEKSPDKEGLNEKIMALFNKYIEHLEQTIEEVENHNQTTEEAINGKTDYAKSIAENNEYDNQSIITKAQEEELKLKLQKAYQLRKSIEAGEIKDFGQGIMQGKYKFEKDGNIIIITSETTGNTYYQSVDDINIDIVINREIKQQNKGGISR